MAEKDVGWGQLDSILSMGAGFVLHCVAERQEIARRTVKFRGALVACGATKHLYSAF
ncbi:hypothetical protein [Cupriavidus consociatus]|uniref:hypothetical protein n=1 Tax=Cupriavidus consociatus TaxID=2821357 RepID=UPI001AE63C33|nr:MULTISPECIES: hypothetical protein [unclassified Cupriavidus]MBP0620282.1 hypothetical protein [Cupriavidus sp. LEh25]MDK2656938.1 hypothetical protein [Cupriavidus sp. LEh21]